jgi:hypothetical protein
MMSDEEFDMGNPVRLRHQQDSVARFIECYHVIQREDTHEDLQKDLMEERGHGGLVGSDRGVVVVVELCDELCVLVMNYAYL